MVSVEHISKLQNAMESVEARVPVIVLQRVEERYPAVREGMVSAACMCAQERVLSFYS
jgi:hypothetical protein